MNRKNVLCKILATFLLISCMSACSNSKSNDSSSIVTTNTQSETTIAEDSVKSECIPYRIVVDDSLTENPLPEQYKNNDNVMPETLYEHSALVYAYDGYVSEEDMSNPVGNVVLIIATDPANNLNEFNTLTTNSDYTETSIIEGDKSVTVKTALNYKGELYIIMEDNVAAVQEVIPK